MTEVQDSLQLQQMVQSLEAQLIDLYEERQKMPNLQNLQSSIKSLEEQLVDLYAERAELPIALHHVKSTISSLEEQVISLVDEKMEMQRQIESLHLKMETLKYKSKVLGAAIMEAALFDGRDEEKKDP